MSKKLQIEADEVKPIKNCEFLEAHLQLDTLKYTKPKEPHWLLRRIYILTWIRKYNRETAISDLIAGITLGLTIIPQAIAYASLAGLSSEYGLYSAFIGSIIYVFFGTIPQVSIGPTSLMALLISQFCADKPLQMVIMLAFLAGLVELLMGIFQLGFIVNFIPSPVNKAFTTATAIIVALAQVKNLLGIRGKGLPKFPEFFSRIKFWDATLGFGCIIVLLLLRQLSQVKIDTTSVAKRRIKKLLWYISISRNALVVFVCALYTYLLVQREQNIKAVPYLLSANVTSAHLSIQIPPFAFEHGNRTYVFTDIINELGSAIIVVPVVAVLANVAIAKAFVKDGKLDASQEMLTLGLCNLAGSFFSAMPTCGAFTRSAVSASSGVKTPMAGVYTGLLVLSALSILTPYFQYIPRASLAAVLIAAVIFMIDFTVCKKLWHSNKKDFFSWLGCFIVCIFNGVEMGLLFGSVVCLIFILLRLGNPKLDACLRESDGIVYIHIVPHSDIYYSGAEYLRGEIRNLCTQYKNDFPIVLDCTRFMQFDGTFVDMINAVSKELGENDVLLVLQNLNVRFQQLLQSKPNLRFCDGVLTNEDLSLKK